ncbi:uncharacterized protein [Eleutherodactylus coqui]|uniref:uncharacterized protein isoform X2 n=1 Tax=Eleutherodactylus coqui TaxID=57060 RepID=UPI00346320FD
MAKWLHLRTEPNSTGQTPLPIMWSVQISPSCQTFERKEQLCMQRLFFLSRCAGHFEHVALMNTFDNDSPRFRISAKISFVKLSAEEGDPSGLGDEKINASDPTWDSDICSKLIEQVKLDVRLRDSEGKSEPENSTTSRERRMSKGQREEHTNKTQAWKDEGVEWAKAKGKVEEFLDFPGLMAAMAYRNQVKGDTFSQSSSRNSGGLVSHSQPDTIPNTRHNAIFLRDHQKIAEAILLKPHYQKVKLPQAVDSQQSTMKSQDHDTKRVDPKSVLDSQVLEYNTGAER